MVQTVPVDAESVECESLQEAIVSAYSHGWHDGQDVIVKQIKHVDKGGDEAGLNYYNTTFVAGRTTGGE